MKRVYLAGAFVLAIGCSNGGKPPASKEEVVSAAPVAPAPPKATPEEQAAALRRAEEAIAATTAAAQQAQAEATAQARAEAIALARQEGVLGSTALLQGGAFASLTGTGDISSGFDDADIAGGLLGNDPDDASGGFGFGRSGFGPGGGGTGAGTIGTGRYGTLGHGSGTGAGYGASGGRGGMRGRTANVPQVRIGQPTSTGALDKAIIRRYIKRNIQRFTYCYEKQLLATPTLEGTVRTSFSIAPSGAVPSATADGVSPDVSSCIAAVLRGIEFPKPTDGAVVQCTYPFTFSPS